MIFTAFLCVSVYLKPAYRHDKTPWKYWLFQHFQGVFLWRRRRDSNSRDPYEAYTISSLTTRKNR